MKLLLIMKDKLYIISKTQQCLFPSIRYTFEVSEACVSQVVVVNGVRLDKRT